MTAIEVSNSSSLGPHPRFPSSVKPGIPKLPETKSGWSTLTIGKLFDVVERPVTMRDDEHYRLVTVKRSRGGVVERDILPGRKISVKTQFYVKPGDFLISKRQIVHGACGFVPEELDGAIVSNEYSVLRCKPIIDPIFLLYLSFTPYFQQTCFHSSIGVHVEKMIFKLSDWFKWKIRLPSYEEQQKIASFLSAVDSKITKLREKRELLDTYKRGMMQKLFSQELCFKADDGSEYPEWKPGKLGDYAKFSKGAGVSRSDISDTGSNLCIRYGELYTDYSEIITTVISKTNIDRYSLILSKAGDVIIPSSGETREDIATASCVMQSGVALGGDLNILRTNFDGRYLAYYLKNYKWRDIAAIAQGSSVVHLYSSQLASLKVEYPVIEEQQKIADCLSTIDKKIDAVAHQIAQMETFKQGLLQKMFV